MKKALLFLFLFFLSFKTVHADRYFQDGNIMDNKYYDTLGFGVDTLEESKECPNCIEYNVEDIVGVKSSDIVGRVNINDITTPDPVYGLIRVHGLYDEIALPPYSSLDFIYWSSNMAGSSVNIPLLKVFLSRINTWEGDLTKILDISGEYETLPIKYIVWDSNRSGVAKTYEGPGIVADRGGAVNGMKLDTVYVKSPLTFVRWEAQEIEEGVLLRVYVKNDFDGVVYSVVYTHQQYSETRHFSAGEEHMYEYIVSMDENRGLGYASVYVPYDATECAVRGESMESNYTGQSAIVGGMREENGQTLAYIGSRVKPYGIRFCVTRIPYTLYSGEIVLPNNNREEHEESEESSDNQEESGDNEEEGLEVINDENSNEQESTEITEINEGSKEEFGEVLGVKKLPKTGVGINPVLVVFQIVCYYLLRRFVL